MQVKFSGKYFMVEVVFFENNNSGTLTFPQLIWDREIDGTTVN